MKKGFKLIETPRFNVLNNGELNSLQGGLCLCNARYTAPCLCNKNYTPPSSCLCNANYTPPVVCPCNVRKF